MTLRNFLKLHQDGTVQGCVSVLEKDNSKTYFEEERQERIIASDTFKKIANRKVDHFNIIGGGIYPVELCVYLVADEREA